MEFNMKGILLLLWIMTASSISQVKEGNDVIFNIAVLFREGDFFYLSACLISILVHHHAIA
jgi:hypothetical protein